MPKTTPGRTIGTEKAVARRLAFEREDRGWTYEMVARRMEAEGCPIQLTGLHKIEKAGRRVTLDEAIALANVFGIDLDDLVTPLALVKQRRGRELASQILGLTDAYYESVAKLLETFLEVADIAVDAPEIYDIVVEQYEKRAGGAQWFAPYAHLDGERLAVLASQVDRAHASILELATYTAAAR